MPKVTKGQETTNLCPVRRYSREQAGAGVARVHTRHVTHGDRILSKRSPNDPRRNLAGAYRPYSPPDHVTRTHACTSTRWCLVMIRDTDVVGFAAHKD